MHLVWDWGGTPARGRMAQAVGGRELLFLAADRADGVLQQSHCHTGLHAGLSDPPLFLPEADLPVWLRLGPCPVPTFPTAVTE